MMGPCSRTYISVPSPIGPPSRKPAKATVYGWVCAKTIPYSKFSKKLSFNRQKIDEWHRQRQFKSADDIQDIADAYVNSKKM